jgi:hypothetical protein
MRTNPFYDAWLFLIGQTNDHQGSGAALLLTVLFLALLLASTVIAIRNWQQDPSQRSMDHLATWFMRVMIGAMWYQGSLWKLPLPVSGGFKFWTESITYNAAFEFHKWIATHIYLPNLPIVDPLVYLTELALAVAFILGFFVRPMALVGMLFAAHLWLGVYRHPDEWPWLFVFLIFVQGFFLINNAGRSLGLDASLRRKFADSRGGDGAFARLYRRIG